MRINTRNIFKAFAAMALLCVCGCATSGYNKGQFNIISVKEETEVGKEVAQKVDAEYSKKGMDYNDSRVVAYIQALGSKLAANAPEKNYDYTFKVLKNPEINAFALPAGHIYVNTGLIAEADNEAELAGVLSHEIGHVVARHWAERYSAVLVAALAAEVLIQTRESERDRILTQLAVQVVGTGGLLAYSRANEREADQLGVETMYVSGYHPEAMASFFEKMHEKTGDMSKVEVFLSTHPDPRERESRTYEAIMSLPEKQDLIWDTAKFQEIKGVVSEIKYPESEEEG